MKYKVISIALFTAVLGLLLLGCKKSSNNNDPCGAGGGVIGNHKYLFWIDHDFGCGPITVILKDDQGNPVNPFYGNRITVYNVVEPPNCEIDNADGHAVYQVFIGRKYTYSASCASKTWTGNFTASCEQYGCSKIKLE